MRVLLSLFDLFEIRSGIYLPTYGYNIDMLSAEYSGAFCTSCDLLIVRLLAILFSRSSTIIVAANYQSAISLIISDSFRKMFKPS